jgi:hypothetical protein
MVPRMTNVAHDSIRYGYATGWAHLLAVADQVSVLAYEGSLSSDDRHFTTTCARCSAASIASTTNVVTTSPSMTMTMTMTTAETTSCSGCRPARRRPQTEASAVLS